MKTDSNRPFAVDVNWKRAALVGGAVAGYAVLSIEPAWATTGGSDAFGTFQSKITTQTSKATGVAKTVLLTAAVLSLIVGLAPMLWGQIKVKWIITALVACVLFALTGFAVNAFSGETSQNTGLTQGS